MPTNAKKPEQASIIDELADDAVPDEYPAGAPLLKPYLQIRPRSKRAEFKRKYAEFAELQEKTQAAQQSGVLDEDADDSRMGDKLRVWADLDDLYQLMDELMEMAAANPEHYREWSDAVEDNALTAVFQVYMKRSQPGEASRSAS